MKVEIVLIKWYFFKMNALSSWPSCHDRGLNRLDANHMQHFCFGYLVQYHANTVQFGIMCKVLYSLCWAQPTALGEKYVEHTDFFQHKFEQLINKNLMIHGEGLTEPLRYRIEKCDNQPPPPPLPAYSRRLFLARHIQLWPHSSRCFPAGTLLEYLHFQVFFSDNLKATGVYP